MSAYVYLLDHQSGGRFKIGKAVDVRARVRQLGSDQFDYDQSQALRLSSDADAQNLERLLHRAFAKSRLNPEEITSPAGARADGDTEWFSFDCKTRLSEFLAQNQDLLGFEYVPARELKNLVAPPPKAPRVAAVKPGASPKGKRPGLTPEMRAERRATEMRQAENLADSCVALLRELVAMSTQVHFLPPGERQWNGFLRGVVPMPAGRELFDQLMELSFTGHCSSFRYVPSITTLSEGGTASFEVSLLWPQEGWTGHLSSHAAARIAAARLAVPGWP